MNAYVVWVDTPVGKKRYVVVGKDIDSAFRYGKGLGVVTSVMEDQCDAVAVLDSSA